MTVSRPDVDRLLSLDEYQDELQCNYMAAELWRQYVAELTRRPTLDKAGGKAPKERAT